jgi:hypothetical protein
MIQYNSSSSSSGSETSDRSDRSILLELMITCAIKWKNQFLN